MVPPPPSTPAPRRFLPKRPGPPASSSSQATPASRFQSTAAAKPSTQRLEDVEDVDSDDDLSTETPQQRQRQNGDSILPSSSWDEPLPEAAAAGSAKRRKILDDSDQSSSGSDEQPDTLSDENVDDIRTATTTSHPVFQSAPRFKAPAEEEAVPEARLEKGSPRGKHAAYVPGGLAEELQSWLSEVKEQTAPGIHSTDELRVPIGTARPGTRMCLAADTDGKKYILAGSAPKVEAGSTLLLRRPVWDIELGGDTHTVVWNWSIDGQST